MLTNRQAQILRFLVTFKSGKGYPPSRAEICKHFKFASPNAAQGVLVALEKKGAIKIIPHIARGIQITNEGVNELRYA